MRKLILVLLLLINQSVVFSQNDTISCFRVTRQIDTITNREIYFERLDNNLSSELKIIDNKIIKDHYAFKHIKNGLLIKTDSIEIKRDDCIFDIIFYDEINRIYKKVGCKDSKIKFIEKKNKNDKELYTFQLGSLKTIESFKNNDEGFIYEINDWGNIKTYQVFIDKISKKETNRILLKSTQFYNLTETDNNYKDFTWNVSLENEEELCKCKIKK